MGIVLPDLTDNINKVEKYLKNHPVEETKTDASKVVEDKNIKKSCLNCGHYNVCVHISEGDDDYTEAETCDEFKEE